MKKTLISIGLSAAIFAGSYIYTPSAEASTNSAPIIQTSKQFIGTKYVYGGTTPSGFDCSGFIQYIFQQNGISLPRTTGGMYSSKDLVSVNSLQPGDLVFFVTVKSSVSHVGLYIGDGKFIHCANNGVVISEMSSSYWKSRYLGAKRLKNTDQLNNVVQSAINITSEAKNLWNNVQKRYGDQKSLNGIDSTIMKDYDFVKNHLKSSPNAEASEYVLRSAHVIDSLKVGSAQESATANFIQNLINNQNLNSTTDKLYDEFSAQIRKSERVFSRVYGPTNRSNFNNKFVKPAKIAKETVIYEVSMYRLMEKIQKDLNAGNMKEAKENYAMLERLERRAVEIKKAGNILHPGQYPNLPKINQTLEAMKRPLTAALK